MKAVFQGADYKKTLQTHLDEVNNLTAIMDREAIVRSQHRLQCIEESCQGIDRRLKELYTTTQNNQMDEKTIETIAARVGDVLVERLANRTLSFLYSSGGVAFISSEGANIIRDHKYGRTDQLS